MPLAAEEVNFLFDVTFRSFWVPPVQHVTGVLSPKAVVPKVRASRIPRDPWTVPRGSADTVL